MIVNGPDGDAVAVNKKNNRLKTDSITEAIHVAANEDGDAFNINTGIIAVSADTGMLYLKNNEDKDWIIQSLIVFLGVDTYTSENLIMVHRNPTTGTLISTATPLTDVVNRNFGSSEELDATVYKGASGATITNGENIGPIGQIGSGRAVVPLDLELPKGSSIGVHLTFGGSGTANCYAAIIGYRHTAG